MNKAKKIYESNIKRYELKNSELSKSVSFIGWSRLLAALLLVILDYVFYKQKNISTLIFVSIALIIIFTVLVFYHNYLYNKKSKLDILININNNGLKRINGEFGEFSQDGKEYLNDDHPFANDLDIFGKKSLFQLMNTTITQGGKDYLADILKCNKKNNKTDILMKQEAVSELSGKVDWRQKIIVEGTIKEKKKVNIAAIQKLNLKKEEDSILRTAIAVTFIIVTFIGIAASVYKIIPFSFVLLNLTVNLVVIKILCKGIKENILLFKSLKNVMKSYANILSILEDENYSSRYLQDLRKKLVINDGDKSISCKEEMKKLSRILDWIGDSEANAYYLLINILFFADVFLYRKIEKWKNKNGRYLEIWLDTLYEFDALCSIANIPFEHEEWTMPNIIDENSIDAVNVSHPLLLEKGTKNSFSLHKNENVALITGSNMSGKSTFLRTISLNLVLANIGAPVSAEKFTCGIMNVYTCMRTKDNLEENISSFYAEILRIKLLIQACKNKENVFFVLDEIFKGTNSKDRHIGATVLIKQLIKYGGVGLVSTHDLELCDLEKEDRRIVNYNFREFYENNEIKFDYILRKGRSQTQNAIHLMKLAGINIEE